MGRLFLALLTISLLSTATFAEQPAKLTPAELDGLLVKEGIATTEVAGDETFLRRVTLDLVGRQPTTEELAALLADQRVDKRSQTIERLLSTEEYGKNWANYWCDTISAKIPPPELTFLSYT